MILVYNRLKKVEMMTQRNARIIFWKTMEFIFIVVYIRFYCWCHLINGGVGHPFTSFLSLIEFSFPFISVSVLAHYFSFFLVVDQIYVITSFVCACPCPCACACAFVYIIKNFKLCISQISGKLFSQFSHLHFQMIASKCKACPIIVMLAESHHSSADFTLFFDVFLAFSFI